MIIELYVPDEALAAGVEAKREAEEKRLSEAEICLEIYYAMYGQGIKCAHYGEEIVH